MGGEPYFYYVDYQPNLGAALQQLREREFRAGRYNPVVYFPFQYFPIGPNTPAPGARHASIEAAFQAADADGTRSILDLEEVGDTPDFGVAVRLSDEDLENYFGTTRPTRQSVEENEDFWEDIERGQGICVVLYKDNQPDEIFFAGYSYD